MASEVSKVRRFQAEELQCVRGEKGFLGGGSFGTVWLAFHATYKAVALNCMETFGSHNKLKIIEKRFKHEIESLQKSNHEHIVRVHGWAQWSDTFAVVMEYLPGGNLMELLIRECINLSPLLQLRICLDIAKGLSFIHNIEKGKMIVHGDIKPENIMLTEHLHCKVSDFGSARLSSYTGTLTASGSKAFSEEADPFVGLYAAPELLLNPLGKMKPSMDIYSYGMLVYVILNRQEPRAMASNQELFRYYILGGDRPDLEDIIGNKRNLIENGDVVTARALDSLISVMEDCWKHEPSDRPSILSIMDRLHAVIADIPSKQILQCVVKAIREMKISIPSPEEYECVSAMQFYDFKMKPFEKPLEKLASSYLDSPSTQPESSNTPSTTSQYQILNTEKDFRHLLEKIKSYLKNHKDTAAVILAQQLISVRSAVDDYGVIIDDVITVAKMFNEKSEYDISAKLFDRAIVICKTMENTKLRLLKIVCVSSTIDALSYKMVPAHKIEVERYFLPLLRKTLEALKLIPISNIQVKEEKEVLCMLNLAFCYLRIDQQEKAITIGRSCLSKITSLYGIDAKRRSMLSKCFKLLALANHNNGNYGNAAALFKRHINALQSAEDLNEHERKELVENAEELYAQTKGISKVNEFVD